MFPKLVKTQYLHAARAAALLGINDLINKLCGLDLLIMQEISQTSDASIFEDKVFTTSIVLT